jgi:hypothetical protein
MNSQTVNITLVALALSLFGFVGCDDPSGDGPSDSSTSHDSQGDRETSGDSDINQTTGCKNLSHVSVADLLCTGDDEAGTVDYRESNFGRFEIPEESESTPLPVSESRLREVYGNDVEDGMTYGFNREHAIKDPETAYIPSGRDVRLHLAALHDREAYDTSTAKITVLLNFKAVEAKLTNYTADRGTLSAEKEGTTVEFQIDEDIEQYDITIPAEEFDGPGRYSIGVTLSGLGKPNTGEFSREFIVFYGGCSPSPIKCAADGEVERQNSAEKTIAEKTRVDTYLYPSDFSSDWNPSETIVAEPGESLHFTFSTEINNIAHTAAFVPLIDGYPTDRLFHIHIPKEPEDLERGVFVVGGRTEFQIQAPTEPGEYRLEFAQHVNPVLTTAEEKEIGIDTFSFGLGSNNQTIEVR